MTYHYHGIDAEESVLNKSLPNLGTWALPNLFFIIKIRVTEVSLPKWSSVHTVMLSLSLVAFFKKKIWIRSVFDIFVPFTASNIVNSRNSC